MPSFNLYPAPNLPLSGAEVVVIAQQQNGGITATCSVPISAIQESASAAVQSGPTASRPIYAPNTGVYQFFDTTLGQPIWWNNTEWVNAAGASV